MKIATTASIALAFAGVLFLQPLCQAADSKEQKPQDTKDKVSYSIGADIGKNLKRAELDLTPAFLSQGIKDAYVGKLVMSDDEMKATLQAFQMDMQTKMQAKQKVAAEKNKAESDKFLEENKKKEGVVTTTSGLQYKIVKQGDGPKPKTTDTVTVNYRGTLASGKEFDKSDKPATFQLEGVIPGWVEALQLMPVGSKWQIVIPPALAYGENAPPAIGPNQALIFDVELLEIKKGEAAAEPKAEASPAASAAPAASPK